MANNRSGLIRTLATPHCVYCGYMLGKLSADSYLEIMCPKCKNENIVEFHEGRLDVSSKISGNYAVDGAGRMGA